MTIALKDREEYALGSLTVTALHTPCHTRGHVLFFVTSSAKEGEGGGGGAPLVLSGDTLFVGGCGRFFEGDAAQSKPSLQTELCGVVRGEANGARVPIGFVLLQRYAGMFLWFQKVDAKSRFVWSWLLVPTALVWPRGACCPVGAGTTYRCTLIGLSSPSLGSFFRASLSLQSRSACSED